MDLFGESTAGAALSPDGVYRYHLWRELAPATFGTCVFVMLNPSTADANIDDPTIRKCRGFASGLGYRRLEVVNLFAYRATNPRDLSRVADPVGPYNNEFIVETCRNAGLVICAWGGDRFARSRATQVLELLRESGRPLVCLRKSAEGYPWHPLYIPYSQKVQPYP